MPLSIAALALTAPAPGAARATRGSETAYIVNRNVRAAGDYDVRLEVASPQGSQRVSVTIPKNAPRRFFVVRSHQTRLVFRAATTGRMLRVSVVGARFRPRASVAVVPAAMQSTAIGATGSGASSTSAASQYTTLVRSDEFNGPAGAAPSASLWIHDVGAHPGDGEQETYTQSTANTSLDGHGHLAIVARQQTTAGPDGVTEPYTSGRIETLGLFSIKYGLVEARMQIPPGAGLWPAFWMLGDNITSVGWPSCGEIDVMETIDQDPFTVYGTIHGPSGDWQYQVGYTDVSSTSLAAGFHTYGVKWSPNSVAWMLDGKVYATATPANLAPGDPWVFNQPFHLVLNLAVGGNWPGSPTVATQFPATLLVDWVRVYQ